MTNTLTSKWNSVKNFLGAVLPLAFCLIISDVQAKTCEVISDSPKMVVNDCGDYVSYLQKENLIWKTFIKEIPNSLPSFSFKGENNISDGQ